MFKTLFTFTAGLITGIVATKVYEKDVSFNIPILNGGCVKKPDDNKHETEEKDETVTSES